MTFCVSSYFDSGSGNELFSERVRCVDAEIHKLLSRSSQLYELDVNESSAPSIPVTMTYTPTARTANDSLALQNVKLNEINCIKNQKNVVEKSKENANMYRNDEKCEINEVGHSCNLEQINVATDLKLQKAVKECVAVAVQNFIDEHIDSCIQDKVEKCAEQFVHVFHSQLDELRSAQRQWIENLSSKLDSIEHRQRHLEEVYNTDIKEAKSALEKLRRDVAQQMQHHNDKVSMCNDEVKSTITECRIVMERNEHQLSEQRRRHENQQHDALTSMERQVNTWISEYDKVLRQEQKAMEIHKKETMTRLDKYDDALASVMLLCTENANNVERVMRDALTERSELRRCGLDLNRVEMMLLSLSNDKVHVQLPCKSAFLLGATGTNVKLDNKCSVITDCANNRHKEALWNNESKYEPHDNVMLAQEMMRLREDVLNLFEIVEELSLKANDKRSNTSCVVKREHYSDHKNLREIYKFDDDDDADDTSARMFRSSSINGKIKSVSSTDGNNTSATCINNIVKRENNNAINNTNQNVERNRITDCQSRRTHANNSLLHKTWPARYSATHNVPLRAKQRTLTQLHRSSTAMADTENENRNATMEPNSSLPPPPPSSSSLAVLVQSSSETQQYVPAPTSDSESERENLQLSRLALD